MMYQYTCEDCEWSEENSDKEAVEMEALLHEAEMDQIAGEVHATKFRGEYYSLAKHDGKETTPEFNVADALKRL